MQQLQPQTTLQGGKYKIIRTLGQGGFGITYLAEQVMLGRKVAIKEFFYKECCDREKGTSHVTLGTQSNRETVQKFMSKFLKEARTISQLDHPNIIKIYDIFEENNTAYYVMEYIEGENLSELVKRQGALSEVTAVEYIKKVADALAYIHARSINHLDVKPGNIMLRQHDQQIVLIDFGLSKQYDDVGSQTSSTPIGVSQGYAPIEQYRAGGVAQFSPQTDIYSLGATLYWLIIGKTPSPADEILDEGLPAMPSYMSSSVKKAIESAMQVKKKDRPQNVKDFLKILDVKQSSPSLSPASRNALSNDEETRILHEGLEEKAPKRSNFTGVSGDKNSSEKKIKTPVKKANDDDGDGYGISPKNAIIIAVIIIFSIVIFLLIGNGNSTPNYNQEAVNSVGEDCLVVDTHEDAYEQKSASSTSIEQSRKKALDKFSGKFSIVAPGAMKGGITWAYDMELDPVNSSCQWVMEDLVDIRNSKGYCGTFIKMEEAWEVYRFSLHNDLTYAIVEMRRVDDFYEGENQVCKVKLELDEFNNIKMSFIDGNAAPYPLWNDDGTKYNRVATFYRE